MIVPSIVTAVAIYNTFARLGLTDTIAGMILAHTILGLPFVLINVLAVLQKVDWRIVDAARSLGATPSRALLLVTLPAIMPGVLAGALFAFVTSFDEVVVALFLSGTSAATLPVQMWNGIRFEINPTVAAVSVILILFTSIVFALATTLKRGSP
jgi:putative spermidine/putrescine transport system permease protein